MLKKSVSISAYLEIHVFHIIVIFGDSKNHKYGDLITFWTYFKLLFSSYFGIVFDVTWIQPSLLRSWNKRVPFLYIL